MSKGVASRRQAERQARIDAIKEAAWRVFLKDGFDSAKIADIAADCRLGLSTLYYYFRDKRQIVYSLMLDFKNDIDQSLIALIEQNVTYREFVGGYIDIHLRELDRFRFFVFADSFYNYHFAYDLSDPVLDEYNRVTTANGRYIIECLTGGREERVAARVRVAIRMILGSLRRFVLLPSQSWPATEESRREMLDALNELACSLFQTIGFDVDVRIARRCDA